MKRETVREYIEKTWKLNDDLNNLEVDTDEIRFEICRSNWEATAPIINDFVKNNFEFIIETDYDTINIEVRREEIEEYMYKEACKK